MHIMLCDIIRHIIFKDTAVDKSHKKEQSKAD